MKNPFYKLAHFGKRALSTALAAAIVLGAAPAVSIAGTAQAEEDLGADASKYLELPEFPGFELMPRQLAENLNSSISAKFNNDDQCNFSFSNTVHWAFMNKSTPMDYSLSNRRLQATGGTAMGTVKLATSYGTLSVDSWWEASTFELDHSNDLHAAISCIKEFNTVYRYYTKYREHPSTYEFEYTGWDSTPGNVVMGITEAHFFHSFELLYADMRNPGNTNFTADMHNNEPIIWLNTGDELRPHAANSVNADVLKTLKIKVTFIPRVSKNLDVETTEVEFEATVLDGKRIGFTAVGDQGDVLQEKEWRLVQVDDMSEYGEYPLMLSIGSTMGCTVESPITDIAGNPLILSETVDLRKKTVTLDAVEPQLASAEISGSMIKDDAEPAREDLFATYGDWVGMDLIMTEQVHVAEGYSNSDVRLKWNVTDADGNYVTTPLKEIQSIKPSLNSGSVSKLVFEPITIAEGMEGKIEPLELIGVEYIRDGSFNYRTDGSLSGITDKQFGIDTNGPTVDILGDIITVTDDIDEKQYTYKIAITDGDVLVDGIPSATEYSGAGIMAGVMQKYGICMETASKGLQWQAVVNNSADAVDFDAVDDEGNPLYPVYNITDKAQYNEIELIHGGEYFLHIRLKCENDVVEIPGSVAINTEFVLTDAIGNTSKRNPVSIVGIEMDNKAPELQVFTRGFTITKDEATDTNTTTFTAGIIANDPNLQTVYYQWTDEGAAPADSAWIPLEYSNGIVNYEANVAGTVAKQLHVKTSDKVGNLSTYTSPEGTFKVDLTSVKPRYDIIKNDVKYGEVDNVQVLEPWMSTGDVNNVYTRVVMTLYNPESYGGSNGKDVYVAVLDSSAAYPVNLFDNTLEWTPVTIDYTDYRGNYTEVGDTTQTIDWSKYYGSVDIELAASTADLAPVAGEFVDVSSSDLAYRDLPELSVYYTCTRDDVYDITDISFVNGSKQTALISGSIMDYYNVGADPVGYSYKFNLTNTLDSSVSVADIDFENSYAVFEKLNNDGSPTGEFISDKFSLAHSESQNIAVPHIDGGYETGAYRLSVFIRQKAGGEKLFESVSAPFVVNNTKAPEYSGVSAYEHGASVTAGGSFIIDLGKTANRANGEKIDVINVGVAETTTGKYDSIIYQDGMAAFLQGTTNGAYNDGDVYYDTDDDGLNITFSIKPELVTVLGEELGNITDVRIWNDLQKGSCDSVGWLLDENGETAAKLDSEGYYTWTKHFELADDLIEYDALIAHNKSHGEYLAEGRNIICYQFMQDNGELSPIYSVEVNISSEAPSVQVSFKYNQAIESTELLQNYDNYNKDILGTEYSRYTANALYFNIDSMYSDNGEISVYRATLEDNYSADAHWTYEKLDTTQPIKIQNQNIDGYCGYEGTAIEFSGSSTYSAKVSEFYIVMDEYGNASTFYPIVGTNSCNVRPIRDSEGNVTGYEEFSSDPDEYNYGYVDGILRTYHFAFDPSIGNITDAQGEFITEDDNYSNLYESVYNVGLVYIGGYSNPVDQLEVSVDGGVPVTVDTLYDAEENPINNEPNAAGIISYDEGTLTLVFPYDNSKAEGEMIEHTISLKGYINGELAVNADGENAEVDVVITAPNIKPAIEQSTTAPELGAAYIKSNVYLYSENITEHTRKVEAYIDGTDYLYYDMKYALNGALPVYQDGTYTNIYYDVFGNEYELTVDITGMPTDPSVTVSTTELTKDPVTVTVTSGTADVEFEAVTGADDYADAYTLPNGSTEQTKAVDGGKAYEIVLTDCAEFWVRCTYNDGSTKYVKVNVDNIFNKPVDPEIVWAYDEGAVVDGVYYGDITAILTDKNGSLLTYSDSGAEVKYTFTPDDQNPFTFTGYVNKVGVEGEDVIATPPVTLKHPEPPAEDNAAPALGITGTMRYKGSSAVISGAFISEPESDLEEGYFSVSAEAYKAIYGDENVFTDTESFINSIGPADMYSFDLDILDESPVKVFISKGKNTSVPTYSAGKSDSVEGVSLVGRTLQITDNCEFSLHIVDAKNNSTSVLFNITALGKEFPDPIVTQALTKKGDAVRVYISMPEIEGVIDHITDLKLTNEGAATEEDTKSKYYGMPYLSVEENGTVILNYSYMYDELEVTGSIEINVTCLDFSIPQVKTEKWSANYDASGVKLTNQDITAQFDFTKTISDAYFSDKDGNKVASATGIYPFGMTLAYFNNKVTVIYEDNADAVYLTVVAAPNTDLTNTIPLPGITTIDKEAPVLNAEAKTSFNHRYAIITLTTDEDVTLPDGTYGTEYEIKVRENGEYNYRISDKAGNASEATVVIDDVISENLSIILGNSNGEIIDPETYSIDLGDKLYIKTNRNATVRINCGADTISTTPDNWTEFTIEEDSIGMPTSIYAVDEYGNSALVYLSEVPVRDRTRPSVMLRKGMISASVDEGREGIEKLLRENIIASDDVTATADLKFSFELPASLTAGKYAVKYIVEDEAGNKTETRGWVRLYSGDEISIEVNGTRIERDETVIATAGTQTIDVTFTGEPYKIVWRTGIKSVGQMKNNANYLTAYTDKEENSMSIELSESGYYTFLVTTQGRDVYRFMIYVEV